MSCSKRKPKRGAKRAKEKMLDDQRHRLRNHCLDAIEESVDQFDDVEESATWLRALRDDIDMKLAALDEQIQYAKEHS